MSVVVRRDHPSGSLGLSVEAFPDTESIILGIGPLEDMKFFGLSVDEADAVESALSDARERALAGA